MRAVAIADNRSLAVVELAEAPLAPEEVRIRVAYCGVCGSDLHMRRLAAIPAGTVLGHECAGEIVEVGSAVGGWRAGDRVAVYPFRPCWVCDACRAGATNVCLAALGVGVGQGVTRGAFADCVVVCRDQLIGLPDALPLAHGALVEPLAVAVHGVAIGGAGPGMRTCVLGAGPVGLMTAFALRARGVEQIVLVDPGPGRRERASSLGFHTLDLDDVHARVPAALGGGAPAVVFECAGQVDAAPLAVDLVAPLGRVVLLGTHLEAIALSQLQIVLKEAQIRGSVAYTRDDFAESLAHMASGRIPAAEVITEAPLAEAERWFAELERPETRHLKVLLQP